VSWSPRPCLKSTGVDIFILSVPGSINRPDEDHLNMSVSIDDTDTNTGKANPYLSAFNFIILVKPLIIFFEAKNCDIKFATKNFFGLIKVIRFPEEKFLSIIIELSCDLNIARRKVDPT